MNRQLSQVVRRQCLATLIRLDEERRRKAAQALHTIPDPMTAREREEREAASGECG